MRFIKNIILLLSLGCQGLELIASFRKLLNPYQVFNLDNGGPLPGLYVFRHIGKCTEFYLQF